MDNNIKWIDFATMERFMVDVFKGIGVPEEDADLCGCSYREADKQGIDSHGTNRLKPIYYDRIKDGIQFPKTNFEIVREGPTTAVVDGHHGMGMVIGKRSMEMAIERQENMGWAWSLSEIPPTMVLQGIMQRWL